MFPIRAAHLLAAVLAVQSTPVPKPRINYDGEPRTMKYTKRQWRTQKNRREMAKASKRRNRRHGP